MATAPAPSRSSGSFSISLGLLNVPVSLYTGTEAITVKRSQWTADGQKVGNQSCVKHDDGTYGRAVERSEIVKRYDTGAGLVEISDSEIDALATTTPGVADILSVQRLTFLNDGTYVPNGQVWQVRASRLGSGRAAKPNPGGQRAFALLLAALKAERSFALLRFGKDGTVKHAALLHTGDLIGLYTDEEVREDAAVPTVDLIEEELDLARALLRSKKSSTPVAVHNDLVPRVHQYALAKISTEGAPKMTTEAPATTTVDLMAVLRDSLEAARAKVSV